MFAFSEFPSTGVCLERLDVVAQLSPHTHKEFSAIGKLKTGPELCSKTRLLKTDDLIVVLSAILSTITLGILYEMTRNYLTMRVQTEATATEML